MLTSHSISSKNFRILIFCIFFTMLAQAQQQSQDSLQKSKFWSHVHFGGGIGLGFSNNYTTISLSPTAIYQFNDQFALGIGFNVNYSKRKDFFNATLLGGSLISLYNPMDELQLSAEFEQNSVNINYKDSNINSNSYTYPSLFLGIGYTVGNFGAVGVRYDVLYDSNKSIYGSAFVPFFRVFF